MEEEYVVGKVHLNGPFSPFIEVLIDTNGRSDGEIILLKEIASKDSTLMTEEELNQRMKKFTETLTTMAKSKPLKVKKIDVVRKRKKVKQKKQEVVEHQKELPNAFSRDGKEMFWGDRALAKAGELGVVKVVERKITDKEPVIIDKVWFFELRRHPKTKRMTVYLQRRVDKE
jgi:hypothetical protein